MTVWPLLYTKSRATCKKKRKSDKPFILLLNLKPAKIAYKKIINGVNNGGNYCNEACKAIVFQLYSSSLSTLDFYTPIRSSLI